MTLNEYQEMAFSTCLPTSDNDIYAITGLSAEVGEINDKIAKWVRKGYINLDGDNVNFTLESVTCGMDLPEELAKEVGDVLWFVALLAKRIGFSLEEIASRNICKLASRKERNVIDGNGDNR